MTSTRARAQALTQRTLANADLTLDYRDAGYRTAEEAAEALIGESPREDRDVVDLAVRLVADSIRNARRRPSE